MTARPIRIGIIALFMGAAISAFSSTEEKASSGASFRFLKFSDAPDLCAKNIEGKFVPLDIFSGFIGRPVRLSTQNHIALFAQDKEALPVKIGKELAPPVVTFEAIDAPRQLVVLFKSEDKFEARVIPDTTSHFPFGRVLAVNLTEQNYEADIGGAPTQIPARGSAVCAGPRKTLGPDNASVSLSESGRKGNPDYTSVWIFGPKIRTMAFIYKNSSGRLLVRIIQDTDTPSMAEAAVPDSKNLKRKSASTSH